MTLNSLIIGVDEVGRGPLAGNVVSAAVICPKDFFWEGLADSKQLSEAKRLQLDAVIRQKTTGFAFGECTPAEIDTINILQASLLSMKRAIDNLLQSLDFNQVISNQLISDLEVLVDGNHIPKGVENARAVVKGDTYIPAISAASILAKNYRDRQMYALDMDYPQYGFAQHKGYPTKQHLSALQTHGVIESIYRHSFKPVAKIAGTDSD